ncbi:hypothetical protein CPB83DRAFT_311205 [Crepidotus variabilis]|uniref:Uncharacterized protein n=1 Tax=Crepidotus variabilis TaxID=179855 RepID=A0A9P6EGA2_9AGAR|nr:hypothetical protein CPB83DRAFT_311205 [Crepidotus variabilis]
MANSGAPILSFPAILRNPGLTSRFAHLHSPSVSGDTATQTPVQTRKRLREQNEGKRWVRRKDNASFVGNPHVVAATKRDYAIPVPQAQSTFPEPLPAYLPRSVKVASSITPVTDVASANAGRFSVSLKGMRRDLRRAGGRAEALVRDVESTLVDWLAQGGTLLHPDKANDAEETMGIPIGTSGTIVEVSRTPLQLVWKIPDDAFARYIVHCCARYHEVVSFIITFWSSPGKGTDDNRLTYLLRPNVTRPDRRVPAGLDTPPITDLDYSSTPDTDIDSDFISERELESDVELDHNTTGRLSSIVESPGVNAASLPLTNDDSWSIIDEGEEPGAEDFDSASEAESGMDASVDILQPQMQALAIAAPAPAPAVQPIVNQTTNAEEDPDKTLTAIRPHALQINSPRRRDWASGRSASSPSRSPGRARRRRRAGQKKRVAFPNASTTSFYNYLFQ